jgi:hypothetical protein
MLAIMFNPGELRLHMAQRLSRTRRVLRERVDDIDLQRMGII